MISAWVLLLSMGAAAVGWVWAADKPQAGAAFAMWLGMVLCQLLKQARRSERMVALTCSFGVGYHASGLACVAMYPALSSKEVGVCEEASGLPVGLLLCAGLLLVVAEAFNRGRA